VDQVISTYHHHLRAVTSGEGAQPANPWQEMISQGMDLLEYVEMSEPNRSSANRQTWYVAGRPRGVGDDDPVLLKTARQKIKRRFVAIGTSDRSADLVPAIARLMGWRDPPPLPRLNTNPERPDASEIDPEIVAKIEERNALDLALYRHVCALEEAGTAIREIEDVMSQ
jgi:hypothetical protein